MQTGILKYIHTPNEKFREHARHSVDLFVEDYGTDYGYNEYLSLYNYYFKQYKMFIKEVFLGRYKNNIYKDIGCIYFNTLMELTERMQNESLISYLNDISSVYSIKPSSEKSVKNTFSSSDRDVIDNKINDDEFYFKERMDKILETHLQQDKSVFSKAKDLFTELHLLRLYEAKELLEYETN